MKDRLVRVWIPKQSKDKLKFVAFQEGKKITEKMSELIDNLEVKDNNFKKKRGMFDFGI